MTRLVAIVAPALLLAGCLPAAQQQSQELSTEGLRLYRSGAYAEARESFRAALAFRPEDPDLLYNLARCHERLKNAAEAEQLYHRVLDRDPDHLEARHALVSRRAEAGQRDAARSMVDAWLKANPNVAGPYIEDAWLRARDGDLDSARARLQQALDREPRHPRALAELARVYVKLDRPDRAIVLYERSLEANPDQPAVAREAEQLRARGVRRPRPD
jgi:tetratricopeptide (TPR) repeat protein